MNCFRPKRIKNKYTDEYMYVECRECDACRINMANKKTIQLAEDLKKYKKHWLVTLDYDNWSVPFVVKGMRSIFRCAEFVRKQSDVEWQHSDFPIIIDTLNDDEMIDKKEVKYLRKHLMSDAVAVLYYPDLQNFIKRLRKRLDNGKIRFKYFAVGEYGPRTQRCHFHIVIYGNDERLESERLKTAIVESWPFKCWYRPFYGFDEESFKRCDVKTASYVASYVNGSLYSNGVSSIRRFRQKTQRSKDIDYGIADQSKDKITKYVNGYYDEQVSKIGGRIFEVIDYSRVDRICSQPIPSRYFFTIFPKYKGFGKATFDSFQARAGLIYLRFNSPYKKQLIDNEVLSSLDLSFMRGFQRYKELLINKGGSDSQIFSDYLITYYNATRLYNALCLQYEMKQFEVLGKDYFLTKINTYAENLEKRQRKISAYAHHEFSTLEINKPPQIMRCLHDKINKYYYKLLPKHFNDI